MGPALGSAPGRSHNQLLNSPAVRTAAAHLLPELAEARARRHRERPARPAARRRRRRVTARRRQQAHARRQQQPRDGEDAHVRRQHGLEPARAPQLVVQLAVRLQGRAEQPALASAEGALLSLCAPDELEEGDAIQSQR